MCDCLSSPTLPLPLSIPTAKKFNSTTTCLRLRLPYSCVPRNGGLKYKSTRARKSATHLGLGFKETEGEEEKKNDKEKETDSLGFGFNTLELKDQKKMGEEDQDFVTVEDGSKIENETKQIRSGRRGKQVIKRSNILAKQVITIQSALTLGFVSQIWVDTSSLLVLVVQVRPNLLSGESERFCLEDVSQVGDVVLVEDENVMDNELKMIDLETLVGYRVVTPGWRDVGKVRGYCFDVNSGAVESLEIDSFGISIIPSSLVSTYVLPAEYVLEVLSDTVIVHEDAASHVRRLTKGFWDARNSRTKIYEFEDSWSTQRNSSSQKIRPKIRESEDEWELPMDYL